MKTEKKIVNKVRGSLANTSEWCSQIFNITQVMASRTLERGSANILMRFGKSDIIIRMNYSFSSPSVIAPRAKREEYLFFQSEL
jgi:hypothetical protein